MIRLALSEISTVNASFAEDVAAYAAAGFDAIGLWEFKLPQDDTSNRDLLRAHRLAVANCVPVVPSILQLGIPGMEGPAEPETRIEAIRASIGRLAEYEPECVLVLSGPTGELAEDDARAIVVGGLRRIAATAREKGVRLGFEPIHPSERDSTSFVNSLAAAVDLLTEAGLDEVGIMVDTFNLWDDVDAAKWLAANPGRVAGVHLGGPPGADKGRTLPGESGPRERELVDALRRGGWDGSLDVEIFSTADGFWGRPVDEAARRAYTAARPLLGKARPHLG